MINPNPRLPLDFPPLLEFLVVVETPLVLPVPEYASIDYDQTGLKLGKKTLIPHVDFYPVAYSGNGEISGKTLSIGYGIVKEDGSYNDYEGKDLAGKIAVLNVSSPDGVHPHSAYAAYHSVNQRLKLAKANGAAAVLLINPEKTASDVPEFFKAINSIDIPVLFVRNEAAAEKLAKKSQKVSLAVSMKERYSTGYNLAGFINNNKARTVVLGAHYDHIGMGGENSLYKGAPAIHNGADDNGSGTTLLLEAIRYYGKRQDTNYNYVILFFSAEESGLIGSKYYTKNPRFPMKDTIFMLNMDMIGYLKSYGKLKFIGGTSNSYMNDLIKKVITVIVIPDFSHIKLHPIAKKKPTHSF